MQRYVAPLLAQGADTLVLGCTHYPFVLPLIELAATGKAVTCVDTGAAVARQLHRLLQQQDLLRKPPQHASPVTAYTTGSRTALASAFHTLLALKPSVEQLASERFATEP